MVIYRGQSDFKVNVNGKNIGKEELESVLEKVQSQLEAVKGNIDEMNINQNNPKEIAEEITSKLFSAFKSKWMNKVKSNTQSQFTSSTSTENENKPVFVELYEVIRDSSKEFKKALPPIDIFVDSFPQVYVDDNYSKVKIIYKDKTILNFDLAQLKKNNEK